MLEEGDFSRAGLCAECEAKLCERCHETVRNHAGLMLLLVAGIVAGSFIPFLFLLP